MTDGVYFCERCKNKDGSKRVFFHKDDFDKHMKRHEESDNVLRKFFESEATNDPQ